MQTPPFFAVQKQNQNGINTILAVEYTLDAEDLDPTCDLQLYVDTLTIPGQIFSLAGKNIQIIARQILCTQGAGFDTSGQNEDGPVVPINPPKAENGSGPGQWGINGNNGGATPDTVGKNGQCAGNITIYTSAITGTLSLTATGGNGQQGQDGQDGGDGINGGNGNDAIIFNTQHDMSDPDGWKITPATQGVMEEGLAKGGMRARAAMAAMAEIWWYIYTLRRHPDN